MIVDMVDSRGHMMFGKQLLHASLPHMQRLQMVSHADQKVGLHKQATQ